MWSVRHRRVSVLTCVVHGLGMFEYTLDIKLKLD
jgi:hypothetical protein